MTEHGGTVRYHRAKWHPDGTWAIRFIEDGPQRWVSWAEGEAMGLTPAEPAPLVVTCNGHSIELNDEQVQAFINTSLPAAYGTATREIGNLLRDARQDPQPASEPLPVAPMIIGPDEYRPGWSEHEWQSPPTYPQPEQDDTPGIDFDALPIGTVLSFTAGSGELRVKVGDRQWLDGDSGRLSELAGPSCYSLVYQPAPLSPGECLRGLLAGHEHADELIDALARFSRGGSYLPVSVVTAVIDAAREVHG